MGEWSNEGGGVAEYAGVDNFPAGSEGLVVKDSNSGQYFQYNMAVGMYLPPTVQPSAVLKSLDGSDTPANQDADWTVDGTESITSDGSEITVADTGGSWALNELVDAVNIVSTKNIGVILSAKVTAENTTASGWKAFLGFKPSAGKAPCLSIAGGADGLGGAAQVYPMSTAAGGSVVGVPTYSPDNSAYHDYFVFYFKDTDTALMGALDDPLSWFALSQSVFATNYLSDSSVVWGTYTGAGQATIKVNNFKLFNF